MSFKEKEEKVETVIQKKFIVKKHPDGMYVWAYPTMGRFDSYNFKYVEGFFKSRNVEFEVIIVKDDNKPIK